MQTEFKQKTNIHPVGYMYSKRKEAGNMAVAAVEEVFPMRKMITAIVALAAIAGIVITVVCLPQDR